MNRKIPWKIALKNRLWTLEENDNSFIVTIKWANVSLLSLSEAAANHAINSTTAGRGIVDMVIELEK